MGLHHQIMQDMKDAMKAKQTAVTGSLRLLNSKLKYARIEAGAEEVSDEVVVRVVTKMRKELQDSIDQYQRAGRQDLVDKESLQLQAISKYLPQQMPAEEVTVVVKETIAELGASSPADMGKVMKALMAKTSGRADGKLVSQIVKDQLS